MIVRHQRARGPRGQNFGVWWMALVPLITGAMKPKEGPYVPPPPDAPQISALSWAALGLGAVVLIGGVTLAFREPKSGGGR